jgi:hypothetical protein
VVRGMSNEQRHRHEMWNELSDADALWGPLLFLRPGQHEPFTRARLFLVCSSFGMFYGLCGSAILAWIFHLCRFGPVPIFRLPLLLSATSLLCGEFSFVRAWNGRARQIARQISWAAAKRRVSTSVGDAERSKSEA